MQVSGHPLWARLRFKTKEIEDNTEPGHKKCPVRRSISPLTELFSIPYDDALVGSISAVYRHSHELPVCFSMFFP